MAVKRIDHIAIVVPNVENAADFYEDALGLKVEHIERVDGQEVTVAFLPVGSSEIELLEPVNDTSGVAKFLAKHGPGMHHMCLEVDDLDATLARLKAKGVQLINEEPTVGSGGKRIAFIHPKSTSGVLIELYETTPAGPAAPDGILGEIGTRIDVERRAVSAGITAFVRSLGEDTAQEQSPDYVANNSQHIPIKPPRKRAAKTRPAK